MSDKKKEMRLLPRFSIYILDKDPVIIGGMDKSSSIKEINFYSSLNSFAFNADITIEDVDNTILNLLSEATGAKATICLYEPPTISEPFQSIKNGLDDAKKVFQKTFSVDKIEVLKFDTNYPPTSKLKIILRDVYDSLVLNKIMCFSNFNLKWDSSEMEVEPMIHRLLRSYEFFAGKMIIPKDIFGVNESKLKRRFATDRSTPLRDVFRKYIDSLYNTRWYEYLTKGQPILDVPTCQLAYTNLYSIDDDGIFHQRPYLTASNIIDSKPDKNIYSLPYVKKGLISNFAFKDNNVSVDDMAIDLRGCASGELKEKILAIAYRKHTFDAKRGYFEDMIKRLDKNYQLNPILKINIESKQSPTYLGTGEDPEFSQMDNFNKSTLIAYPFNIKENKYYFSSGDNSYYNDMSEILMKPFLYITLQHSAWHSPGQEIDLRMICSNYENIEPEKIRFFSMNKLISGRWKILNSTTTLKQDSSGSSGNMKVIETLGLSRPRYFRGDNPTVKE